MTKLNPNAKPFIPGSSIQAPMKAASKPIPKAPPLPTRGNQHTASSAGAKLDKHDARTAGTAKPAHNRSLHVGMSGNDLAARGKNVATSYLTKADQNKAAAGLLNSTKGQNKVGELKAAGNATTTRTVVGNAPPSATGKGWNKTAVITRVAEKQPDGSTKNYNAKSTKDQMEMVRKGGKTNIQSTFSTGNSGPLEKPLPGGKLPVGKVSITKLDDKSAGALRKTGGPSITPTQGLGKVVPNPTKKPVK